MNDQSFSYKPGTHNGQKVIFIQFEKSYTLQEEVKTLVGRNFSNTHKCWYVPDVAFYREKFGLPHEVAISNQTLSKISELHHLELRKAIETLQLKGYSPNTIRNYTSELIQFFRHIHPKEAPEITIDDIKNYLLYCINILKLTENSLHSRINAIKFYYEKVLLFEKIAVEIPRPKKQLKLPKGFNVLEIKKILEVTPNIKHNTILKLIYGMGLRVSEIINLKIRDIDSVTMRVFIERAKGKKDRYVNLPESILEQLRSYYKEYKPKEYLFEGQYGGQYTTRSVQQFFTKALKNAKINKKLGVHGLRHSYATHAA